jgi:hypothetical protein
MGKSSLANRYNEAYGSRNQGGARKSVLDWSQHEGEVKFYKIKEGNNKLDIVPYVIASSNHPLVKRGTLKVGDLDYTLDIWVHKNIGPSESDMFCLKKNYGKPCPICDQAEDYKKEGKKEAFDAYKAKRRVFYNVSDVLKPDEGLMVLEQSHFLFEKELIEEAKNSADGEGIVDFADPDEGKTVKFRGSATSYQGHASIEPKNFGFIDRANPTTKLVKKAIAFDALLTVNTSEQMAALMYGEDEAPEADDEEEDEKPVAKRAAKHVEEDDDDEPPAKKPAKEDGPTCPHGYRFGKDNDDKPECEDCKVWKDCARAAR